MQRLENGCAEAASQLGCLESLLDGVSSFGNGTLRLTEGVATVLHKPPFCAPHPPESASRPGWRARAERLAAKGAGVPLLERAAALAPRFDLHPGLAGSPSPDSWPYLTGLDCQHIAFAPGSFDVEAHALQAALDTRGFRHE